MKVQEFVPKQQISATKAASQHLKEQISKSGHKFLRLGIKESGCNRYMYTLDYVDNPSSGDKPFPIGSGINVYVSNQDLPLVLGTTLEFVTEGLNSSLQFKNPNATAHCGCGESFSIEPEES